MKPNDRGEEVRTLQLQLEHLGSSPPVSEISDATYGPGTEARIRAFQANHGLPVTGLVDAATSELLGSLLGGKTYEVSGVVSAPGSASTAGAQVEIVDKNVGGDKVLATVQADATGAYHATITAIAVVARNKRAPDLQARVVAGGQTVAASPVRYNAPSSVVLDIVLSTSALHALHSEHEALLSAVGSVYSGALADLQETRARQDITYLGNKIGWDARTVAFATLADRLSKTSKLAPAFHYALMRAGAPGDEATHYNLAPTSAEAIWKQAVQQGVIPKSQAEQIPAAVARFTELSASHILDATPIGVSTLRALLAVSLGDNTSQVQQFAALQAKYANAPDQLWPAVTKQLGPEVAARLQLDGKLAYLTLDNAPLLGRLHAATRLTAPRDLVAAGYYSAAKWTPVVAGDVPAGMPGDTAAARAANYAELLAAQVRIAFPTHVVADLVRTKVLALPAADPVVTTVHEFLTAHADKFAIGAQSIDQYLVRNKLSLDKPVVGEIKRIQRVYQLTGDDAAMTALVSQKLDSALHIVQYSEDAFSATYGQTLGGDDKARGIHAKARQIHGTTIGVALGYVQQRNMFDIGSSQAQMVPGPTFPPPPPDAVAFPTLEGLFGQMDYCACEDCRSILSPAAYLVDLLQFCAPPVNQLSKPLDVLLARRPDLQYLPLTCENTNTALPYIDLVNETLEYYVVHGQSLASYAGHDTDGTIDSASLLANPQFVNGAAYDLLAAEKFPPPLPFHRRLELLRRTVGTFGSTLADVMTTLRPNDNVERNPQVYAWRDILMERVGLSRQEYALLTDSTIPLATLYGFPGGTTDADAATQLSGFASFSHRVAVGYDDLLAILQTRFINPASALIPKLARLHLSIRWIAEYRAGSHTDADLAAALAALAVPPDPAQYGGDIQAWLKNDANWSRIASLIVVANPTGPDQLCKVDELALRYADPAKLASSLRAIDLVKLQRFIRLWRKLGWTIQQTDDALSALFPKADLPAGVDDAADLVSLDKGFGVLVPRLGALLSLLPSLGASPQTGLAQVLALFGDIGTAGASSLYAQMFASPTLLAADPAFADDGYGNVLSGTEQLGTHLDTLRGAFNLTDAELALIIADRSYNAATPLTIDVISAIFRRGWLARALRISVRELLLLVASTGLDPFAPPDPPTLPLAALLDLIEAARAAHLPPVQALYRVWNQDLSGSSAPSDDVVFAFARSLREAFADIDGQFTIVDDPDGSIARARMALVYGASATDFLFGLVDDTFLRTVPYTHGQPALEATIVTASSGRLTYDDFAKRLSYAGAMSTAMQTLIKNAVGATPAFATAIDALYTASQAAIAPFFTQYPGLAAVEALAISDADPATKRPQILSLILPDLVTRRKRQQALAELTSAARSDATYASTIVADKDVLHAAGDATRAALDDLVALQTADPGITGSWTGYVEAPTSAFYNFSITTDAAAVTLAIDGAAVTLAQAGSVWTNASAVSLAAGGLARVVLTLTGNTTPPVLQWETAGTGWATIASSALYSDAVVENLRAVYVRFLKATALATTLGLDAGELAFAVRARPASTDVVLKAGWLNALDVTVATTGATAVSLYAALRSLLELSRLKSELSPDDDRLLAVLEDPAATLPNHASGLLSLTGWDQASLTALLSQFAYTTQSLSDPIAFARVFEAFALVATTGVAAAALITATTNDPTDAQVTNLQAALRARYDAAGWLAAVKPINDAVRKLSRDALVAYILRRAPESASAEVRALKTADELFEYFLMDVEMDCCMETSRIRLALSSVQLFIERCLMNLENNVSPRSIDPIAWQWMKRYRVWQANREVFLWPENWLDPELRDDASPIFKDTIKSLLQSDITDDAAASAMLAYLVKLEEVAKLEICGMFYEEPTPGKADDCLHVVGRTAGAHRKYYYRRRKASAWTAWEEMKLDIEDNPIAPVVWNGRLFVVWLKLIKQTPINPRALSTSSNVTQTLGNAHASDLKADAKNDASNGQNVVVLAVLNMSEYVDGTWRATKTSSADAPTSLGPYAVVGDGSFDRSDLGLAFDERQGGLQVSITGTAGDGDGSASFFVYNTHSAPVRGEDLSGMGIGFSPLEGVRFMNWVGSDDLSIGYLTWPFNWPVMRVPLTTTLADSAVEQLGEQGSPYTDPFFYQDGKYAFCVETAVRTVEVPNYPGYGYGRPPFVLPKIPPLVVQQPPRFIPPGDPVEQAIGGIVDPAAMGRFVSKDANIRVGLASGGAVKLGAVSIGATGALDEGGVS